MKKLIIEVAVNETVTRSENPNVPLTPEELAEDARRCYDAGASIVHFHPRDPAVPDGTLDIKHLDDVRLYTKAIRLMKERCDIIPYPTYPYQTHDGHEGVKLLFPHVRALRDDPSVRLETFVFFIGASNMGWWHRDKRQWITDKANFMLHGEAADFLRWCKSSGIKPQFGVREPGHIRHIYHFQEMGLVDDPVVVHLNFSDTVPFGPQCDAKGVQAFIDAAPAGKTFEWFIHNFQNNFNSHPGDPETHRLLNMLAVAMGGHVRTGIGDLPLWNGEALSNAQMVEKFANMARDIGRGIASPEEAREILGMERRKK